MQGRGYGIFFMTVLRLINKIIRWIVVAFFASTILVVVAYRFIPVYFTPLMFIRVGEQMFSDEYEVKLHHSWVSLDEMSKYMPVAVMASEDQRFLMHHGFDFEAIKKAAEHNKKKGAVRHGGSTISQQTAKNVFLWQGRSWIRKGLEMYFTVLIEALWGKERIMEVYLNSIEMGNGIYGVEACANDHFGKSAKELTRRECAQIAATLPNPRRFSSSSPSPYMIKRRGQIEKQMKHIDLFPRGE